MFCVNCGKEVKDGTKFCSSCGSPVPIIPKAAASVAAQGVPLDVSQGAPQDPSQGSSQPVPQNISREPAQSMPQDIPLSVPQGVQHEHVLGPIPEDKPQKKGNKGALIAVIVIILLLLAGVGTGAALYFGGDAYQIRHNLESAQAYLDSGEYEDALDYYNEVLKLDRSNVDAYLGIADVYVEQGMYEDAIRILKDGIKNNKKNEDARELLTDRLAEVCLEAAEYYIGERDYETARDLLQDGIDAADSKKLQNKLEELEGIMRSEREEKEGQEEPEESAQVPDPEPEPQPEYTRGADIYAEEGYAEGYMGDVMHTYWFNFSVNGAYVCSEFGGYTPAYGNELLVVEITVSNTFRESLPMYDTDFQIQWNDPADDAYRWPVTQDVLDSYMDRGDYDILPEGYYLSINETRTGLLLYEVPEGNNDFSLSYLEVNEDDEIGDLFFVYFTADRQGNKFSL